MSMAPPRAESFDIHTGGVDLIFPHHEDEIAQSEAATGQTFVADVAALRPPPDGRREDGQVDGQHRAGRRGLLAAGVSPRALRYALISVHYRAGLDFTDDSLAAAAAALDRLTRSSPRSTPYREDRAGRPGPRPPRSAPPGRGSARRSTTTSTSPPGSPRCSTSSATSTAGSSGGRCRRPTRSRRSTRCVTSTACSRSCPTPTDDGLDRGVGSARRARGGAGGP